MKIRTRLIALCGAAALIGSGVLIAVPAGASTTINVANDHATCGTVTGSIAFSTPLKLSGPTTGNNTVTIKATVAGCTDSDNSAVKVFSGSFSTHVVTTNGSSCGGLSGVSSLPANFTVVWKPGSGQAFTPTQLVGTAQKGVSDVSTTQDKGGTFTVPPTVTPWASSYGMFQVGTAYGTTPESDSVDFTGGDGGASSWFSGTTNADLVAILTACSGTGLKAVTFGIGGLAIG